MGRAAKKKASADKKPAAGRTQNTKGTATDKAGQITANKLKRLMADSRAAYKDTRSIAGELGEKIAQAVEHDHLHKKAFAFVRMADRMEPEKLADFLDTVDYYRDISGLNERAAKVIRMSLDDDGQDDGEGDEDEDDQDGNVRPFPSPAGVAAE